MYGANSTLCGRALYKSVITIIVIIIIIIYLQYKICNKLVEGSVNFVREYRINSDILYHMQRHSTC